MVSYENNLKTEEVERRRERDREDGKLVLERSWDLGD